MRRFVLLIAIAAALAALAAFAAPALAGGPTCQDTGHGGVCAGGTGGAGGGFGGSLVLNPVSLSLQGGAGGQGGGCGFHLDISTGTEVGSCS